MTRVLIAFDKFKGALTARQAGEAVAGVLRESRPAWSVDLAPITDGGEGFASILTSATGGREISRQVTGPGGEPVNAGFGLVPLAAIPPPACAQLQLSASFASDAVIAVIEMATASGLALLPPGRRDPWRTTTLGTGELMRAAAEAGAVALLLGVGGSATNDLGLGALAALGLGFADAGGATVHPPVPASWPRLAKITGGLPEKFPPVYLACDVTNPLLGPRGAAAVFGPQKGLRPADRARLEAEASRVADMLCAHGGKDAGLKETPGAGAAGGIAFGLMVAANARLLSGFDLVSAWLDLEAKLAAADIVITGEGRFDASSLEGKGPGAIAARALAAGKAVHVFAGAVTASPRPGLNLHAITPAGVPLPEALRGAAGNLAAAARRVFA
jgi:glycerate kinase